MTARVPARSSGAAFGAVAVLSIAAVAAALVSQHAFGMEPCPWCALQRLVFVAIALVALLGAFLRSSRLRGGAAALVGVLAVSGVAAALWQHFRAAQSASCNLTLADKMLNATGLPSFLPDVFEPRASCADAAVNLLGLPYDFWSLALYLVILLMAAAILLRAKPTPVGSGQTRATSTR